MSNSQQKFIAKNVKRNGKLKKKQAKPFVMHRTYATDSEEYSSCASENNLHHNVEWALGSYIYFGLDFVSSIESFLNDQPALQFVDTDRQ